MNATQYVQLAIFNHIWHVICQHSINLFVLCIDTLDGIGSININGIVSSTLLQSESILNHTQKQKIKEQFLKLRKTQMPMELLCELVEVLLLQHPLENMQVNMGWHLLLKVLRKRILKSIGEMPP